MISTKYSEAIVDVLDILDHMEKEDLEKILRQFIEVLKEHASKNYVPNIDYSKRLVEMDLSEEARSILGVIYRHYWCPEEKKSDFEQRITQNEIEFQKMIREKYNPNNIFKDEECMIQNQDTNLVEIKKESILKRIIDAIIFMFKDKL